MWCLRRLRQHRARHAGGRLWPRTARRAVKGTVAAGGSGNFSPRTGAGYVAYKKPEYAHALSRSDTDLVADAALRDLYGGWSEPVVWLFRRMQDKVRNKLTKRQYENEDN
jgi:hypothetical protein